MTQKKGIMPDEVSYEKGMIEFIDKVISGLERKKNSHLDFGDSHC